jgi:hypothetical protein
MAHQGQANPLSLESSDSDRLCSPKYLHPRNWFTGLGGFYETRRRFTGRQSLLIDPPRQKAPD